MDDIHTFLSLDAPVPVKGVLYQFVIRFAERIPFFLDEEVIDRIIFVIAGSACRKRDNKDHQTYENCKSFHVFPSNANIIYVQHLKLV